MDQVLVNLPNDFGKKERVMGGAGSGCWYRYEGKHRIEQTKRLDIRSMKQRGMLETGTYSISWYHDNDNEPTGSLSISVLAERGMVVSCKWLDDSSGIWKPMKKPIRFTRTKCNYGGQRPWFVCPVCGRRVAILALIAPTVACRHCLGLTYSSQNERKMYRMLRKRNKIGNRIGIVNPMDAYNCTKPKGMHSKTFQRLLHQYEETDDYSEVCFISHFWGIK